MFAIGDLVIDKWGMRKEIIRSIGKCDHEGCELPAITFDEPNSKVKLFFHAEDYVKVEEQDKIV